MCAVSEKPALKKDLIIFVQYIDSVIYKSQSLCSI
jgi:hypothetical protein